VFYDIEQLFSGKPLSKNGGLRKCGNVGDVGAQIHYIGKRIKTSGNKTMFLYRENAHFAPTFPHPKNS
jgi:hypothetical protein